MDILKIIGVGLITCIAVLVVKQVKPEIAVILGISGGIVMLLMTVESLTSIVTSFQIIVGKSGISINIFKTVLKIIGIGYLTEFAASVCIDSGSSGLGDKILLSGKILILALAIPIVTNILDIVIGLLP